jgi:tripartite-type tricarboxylate transporter receptor subunit TctC
MVHVPFKAAPAVHQEMLAGRIDLMMDNLSAVKHQVQAGRLKAYAVSSAARTPQLPDVPTLREAGVDFEGESWFAMFAPAGTPEPILVRLHEVVSAALRDPALSAKLDVQGIVPRPLDLAQLREFVRNESEKFGRIAEAAHIRVE